MKKSVQMFIVVCLLVFGFSTVALGQGTSATDIIKNLRIVSIKSVEVDLAQQKHLIVWVELKNDNDLEIKLTENVEFNFYIQKRTIPGAPITVHLGRDIKHEGNKEPILLPPKQATDVEFDVNMETAPQPVQETVIHMLNFIGKPTENEKEKDLFIKARFDLGFKSERGWSYAEKLRVEWMFCPEQQKRLPLKECFVEPVE